MTGHADVLPPELCDPVRLPWVISDLLDEAVRRGGDPEAKREVRRLGLTGDGSRTAAARRVAVVELLRTAAEGTGQTAELAAATLARLGEGVAVGAP